MGNQRERVLEKRIFAKNETKWNEVCLRVADFLAENEEEGLEFFRIMKEGIFLPNSPTLVNAGVEGSSGQLNACFVLPIEDSMESIFETIKNTALIHKTGGGTGFNFSKLRSKGASVGAHGGQASGPVSFMRAFDAATETVKQGGVRRGANMAVLNVDHPDIEEFITCKTEQNAINNFNLSVGLTEDFMRDLLGKKSPSQARAKELFDMIVEQAWKNGEPGVLFLDRINEAHKRITGLLEEIEATNPCGEQPLLPYECCCLGSLNLALLASSSYNLETVIRIAVTMLNRILDKNNYPLRQNREIALKNRKIGLGVMGYADWLIKKGLVYGSDEALKQTDELAFEIQKYAHKYGAQFENKTVTTIAPTGTISIIAQCSSGIEPNFSWKQTINRADETFTEYAPIIVDMASEHGLTPELFMKASNFPEEFITAQEVSIEGHVRTQAVWQKHIDNAVSKTINLPNSATREDVKECILLAYELGCKGITVYRDGSRDSQVISSTEKKVEIKPKEVTQTNKSFVRPRTLNGDTEKYKIGCGNLYVTVNKDNEGNIKEVFSNNGKGGGCPSQSEALTRVIAKSLQFGVPKQALVNQLKGIRCMSCVGKSGVDVLSCPDAMARALLGESGEVKTECKNILSNTEKENLDKKVCPSCGAESDNKGGCFTCLNCGFSKCG